MKMEMYAVKDIKAGIFHPPLFAHNAPHAIRMCSSVLDNEESQFAKWPADFQIFHIGSFDDQSGNIDAIAPQLLCGFLDLYTELSNFKLQVTPNRAEIGDNGRPVTKNPS